MFIAMENKQMSIEAGFRRKWIDERRIAFFNSLEEAGEFLRVLAKSRKIALLMALDMLDNEFSKGEEWEERIEDMRREVYAIENNEFAFSIQDVNDSKPLIINKEIYWILEEDIELVPVWGESN